jgi:hypothetical protein
MALNNTSSIDISDLIRSSYADEFQFSESSIGQIPVPIKGLPGRNGYHSAAPTMTLTGKVDGVEIEWFLTGETYEAYKNSVGIALTPTEKNALAYKFLSRNKVPYVITRWPNTG